jgi:hypothetical protein
MTITIFEKKIRFSGREGISEPRIEFFLRGRGEMA